MKLIKSIFIFFIFYFGKFSAFSQGAQYFGGSFMPQAQSDIYFNNYQPVFAFSAGVNYLFFAKSRLGFETDLLFGYQKGGPLFCSTDTAPGNPAISCVPVEPFISEKIYLIKTPFILPYRISDDIISSSLIIAGVQPFFLLNGLSTLKDEKKYTKANYSFVLGYSGLKEISPKITFLFQFRLEYGSDIRPIYNLPGYPIGLGVLYAGLMFGITFKSKSSEKI